MSLKSYSVIETPIIIINCACDQLRGRILETIESNARDFRSDQISTERLGGTGPRCCLTKHYSALNRFYTFAIWSAL